MSIIPVLQFLLPRESATYMAMRKADLVFAGRGSRAPPQTSSPESAVSVTFTTSAYVEPASSPQQQQQPVLAALFTSPASASTATARPLDDDDRSVDGRQPVSVSDALQHSPVQTELEQRLEAFDILNEALNDEHHDGETPVESEVIDEEDDEEMLQEDGQHASDAAERNDVDHVAVSAAVAAIRKDEEEHVAPRQPAGEAAMSVTIPLEPDSDVSSSADDDVKTSSPSMAPTVGSPVNLSRLTLAASAAQSLLTEKL